MSKNIQTISKEIQTNFDFKIIKKILKEKFTHLKGHLVHCVNHVMFLLEGHVTL